MKVPPAEGESTLWDTSQMLDYAISYYGLLDDVEEDTVPSNKELWLNRIQRRLRTERPDAKFGRHYLLSEQEAKGFIESDMLDYFYDFATNEDIKESARALRAAEEDDKNYAQIMAQLDELRFQQESTASGHTANHEHITLDLDKMQRDELKCMLALLFRILSNGEKEFDSAAYEEDYRERNELEYIGYETLGVKGKHRLRMLSKKLQRPESYLVPTANLGEQDATQGAE